MGFSKTDKEKAEKIAKKIKFKGRSKIDITDELCEGIDLLLKVSADCEIPNEVKEFTKSFLTILPSDKIQRVEFVSEKIKEILPLLKKERERKEAVKKIYVALSVLGKNIIDFTEKRFDDRELPDDDLMIKLCTLYDESDIPGEDYYEAIAKYISVLLYRLKEALDTNDVETMQIIGIRIDLQALQLEQLCRLVLQER